jgi:hypothetical protein
MLVPLATRLHFFLFEMENESSISFNAPLLRMPFQQVVLEVCQFSLEHIDYQEKAIWIKNFQKSDHGDRLGYLVPQNCYL